MSKIVNIIRDNKMQIEVYNISQELPDLSMYDRIGIVSGIYAFQPGKPLMKLLKDKLPVGKEIFVIYAYGAYRTEFTGTIRELISSRDSLFLGEYACIGFDGFGPFKVSGVTQMEPSVAHNLKECAKLIMKVLKV